MEGGGAKGSSLFSGAARLAKDLSALQVREGAIFKRLGFEHPSRLSHQWVSTIGRNYLLVITSVLKKFEFRYKSTEIL
jgi:hypothetical protein